MDDTFNVVTEAGRDILLKSLISAFYAAGSCDVGVDADTQYIIENLRLAPEIARTFRLDDYRDTEQSHHHDVINERSRAPIHVMRIRADGTFSCTAPSSSLKATMCNNPIRSCRAHTTSMSSCPGCSNADEMTEPTARLRPALIVVLADGPDVAHAVAAAVTARRRHVATASAKRRGRRPVAAVDIPARVAWLCDELAARFVPPLLPSIVVGSASSDAARPGVHVLTLVAPRLDSVSPDQPSPALAQAPLPPLPIAAHTTPLNPSHPCTPRSITGPHLPVPVPLLASAAAADPLAALAAALPLGAFHTCHAVSGAAHRSPVPPCAGECGDVSPCRCAHVSAALAAATAVVDFLIPQPCAVAAARGGAVPHPSPPDLLPSRDWVRWLTATPEADVMFGWCAAPSVVPPSDARRWHAPPERATGPRGVAVALVCVGADGDGGDGPNAAVPLPPLGGTPPLLIVIGGSIQVATPAARCVACDDVPHAGPPACAASGARGGSGTSKVGAALPRDAVQRATSPIRDDCAHPNGRAPDAAVALMDADSPVLGQRTLRRGDVMALDPTAPVMVSRAPSGDMGIAIMVVDRSTAVPPRGRIPSSLGALEVLHELFSWIPGPTQVRPPAEVRAVKEAKLCALALEWRTMFDFVICTYFDKPASEDCDGKRFAADCDVSGTSAFTMNTFPYELDEGGVHAAMWYGPHCPASYADPSIGPPDDVITRDISDALSARYGGYVPPFGWYVNPNMSVPQVFHVQVFYQDVAVATGSARA